MPRRYKICGNQVFHAVFVLGAIALTVNLYIQRPGRSSIGLAIILLGLVFYQRWNRKLSSVHT
jgi:hypothetical protein